ncbi:VOC family protein [Luteipulveratus sp. YIM 133132]|uniref:VOC family protein n=1 Tax=Luteipulveratus flavus TaxID=3031728 RepID=UPI0023AF1452|nr:VOC family protein [Luteipulveratus sp. YIM 133132]MDE9366860.1 VOC family protein [Luteipulveratus sp. YIM 133132]
MALAAYKDLCMDASDAHAQARFWAPLLGWDPHPHDDGDACLRAGEAVEVWVNQVPEPVTAKNRVHIDVNAQALEPIVAAGATVLDSTSFAWTLMRDPDGQEFCVFLRPEGRPAGLYELGWDVTGDARAAHELAIWWGDLLGVEAVEDERGFSYIEDVPATPFESIAFAPVPEPKTAKNRIHLDVTTDDLDALMAAGATRLQAKGEDDIGWHVMSDPVGNEFCAFTPV